MRIYGLLLLTKMTILSEESPSPVIALIYLTIENLVNAWFWQTCSN